MSEHTNDKLKAAKVTGREMGKLAFDLIVIVNRLYRYECENRAQAFKQLSDGLHELEWKAERMANGLEEGLTPEVRRRLRNLDPEEVKKAKLAWRDKRRIG
jgi:hypothetical protein